jgi:TIR domain
VQFTKDEVVNSLRTFRNRRDALLHEDVATFDHHFERFQEFCNTDPLTQSVIRPLQARSSADLDAWWASAKAYHEPKLSFPPDPDEEFSLRLRLIESAEKNSNHVLELGYAHNQTKLENLIELFRTLIIRPFADDLTHRLGEAADLATPEARMLQAVPLNRIPSARESKIFLSHKSFDKPLVQRYYLALKSLGFDPWLDQPNMPAGSNLERELLRGFQESCAAVFFITENFTDEKYLATEIEYAVIEKRKKEKKFAIITLRYPKASAVPDLLVRYVYKDVSNDLEGFNAVLTALPIELGPVRWKQEVV